ncbi:MAG: hypothetical protein IKA18_02455, partial [Clostridia bacterium]|nr:hypothetical protein [Clostridia bacterium]
FDCDFKQSDEFYKNRRNSFIFESEKNKLVYDMEIESIYLLGEFSVKTDGVWTQLDKNAVRYSGNFEIDAPKDKVSVKNIQKQGYPFFAGEMSLEGEIEIAGENPVLELDIKGINAVRVKIGDKEKAKIIAENANGSIDKALEEVSSGNTFQKLSQGIKIIKSLKSSKNTFEVAMMFEGYKEEDLFQIMQNVYRDMLAIKCKNTDVLFYKTEKDAIMGLAQEYSIMALIESIEEINKAISLKSANVSKNANVDGLLLNLLEVKYNCQK